MESPDERSGTPVRRISGVRRYLLLIELVTFFGPCAAMALGSVLTLGPGLALLLQKVLGTIEPVNDVPWLYAIQPVFLSLSACAGLFALQEVARALLGGWARLTHSPKIVMLMVLAGVAAIAAVGLQVIPHQPMHPVALLCVYAPLIATAHLVFLARRLLFPRRSTGHL